MDRKEFVEIMGAMVEMYPGRFEKLGDLAMEMWFECLSDLEYGIARQAIVNHAKSSKFPPTVADIREQYELIFKKRMSQCSELYGVFNEMRTYYPCGYDDENAIDVFFSKIPDCADYKTQLRRSREIKCKVIDYVKRCENGEEEFNMSLSECIRWACGEKVEEEE